jgi:hypothetical protein
MNLTEQQIKDSVEVAFTKNDETVVITGVLTQAKWNEGTQGRRFLTGFIHHDQFERWPNGTRIHTSYVLEEVANEVFRTRSDHHYRVESWAE